MSEGIPLGAGEGPRLEFKRSEALKAPESIAREVVGMLNAGGGEVWVGIREEKGQAIAIQEVPDVDREKRRLMLFLTDVIEPRLTPDEVNVQKVESGGDTAVLRVVIAPRAEHKPYALLTKNGRLFVIRTGIQTRALSRAELFSRQEGLNPAESATARLLEERAAVQDSRHGLFWLRLEPTRKVTLEVSRYGEYLTDPSLSENRRTGWNFASVDRLPVVQPDKLATNPGSHRKVEIRRNGGLLFEVPLRDLSLGRPRQEREIWPLALLEFPTSAFRLAKAIYAGVLEPGDGVLADLALLGARDWILRGGTPGPVVALNTPHRFEQSDDLLSERPFEFKFEEISTNPDACAFRMVCWVYNAFDFSEDAIPNWFERNSGRLILSD